MKLNVNKKLTKRVGNKDISGIEPHGYFRIQCNFDFWPITEISILWQEDVPLGGGGVG